MQFLSHAFRGIMEPQKICIVQNCLNCQIGLFFMQMIFLVRRLNLELNGQFSKAFERRAYIKRLFTVTENEKYRELYPSQGRAQNFLSKKNFDQIFFLLLFI